MTGYAETYRRSLDEPEALWAEAAEALDWDKRWDRVLDDSRPPFYRWFQGARLNTCWNALDRHVAAGRGERTALIWDSPVTDSIRRLTYRQLRDEVARFAGVLTGLGVKAGERVLIYMPMVPEAAVAMLACARIGAVHSVVFGGFAAHELATRIDDARPRVVLAASCGVEVNRIIPYKPLLDAAIAEARAKPLACVILQRPMLRADLVAGRDRDWEELAAAARPADCVAVAATDPLYILYTSGTTGRPKGVVRDNGGHAVALWNSMRMIYGVDAGDTYWAASDVGWVVGHSYIVYAPLLRGCTTIMYEGKPVGTPDAGAFWRVCARHGVKVLFTAPTAIRAIKQQDPEGRQMARHDLDRLEALYLAGERCDPPTAEWAAERLRIPVVDHWWQTETGWPITAGFRDLGLFPFRPGSGGRPSPGYDLRALEDEGHAAARGQTGNLCARLPLPPGCAPTLWDDDAGHRRASLSDFPGWYRSGAAGTLDAMRLNWGPYLWMRCYNNGAQFLDRVVGPSPDWADLERQARTCPAGASPCATRPSRIGWTQPLAASRAVRRATRTVDVPSNDASCWRVSKGCLARSAKSWSLCAAGGWSPFPGCVERLSQTNTRAHSGGSPEACATRRSSECQASVRSFEPAPPMMPTISSGCESLSVFPARRISTSARSPDK